MNVEQSRKELIERDNLYCTGWKKNSDSSTDKSYYVRIWKREPGAYWKITLEMLSLE